MSNRAMSIRVAFVGALMSVASPAHALDVPGVPAALVRSFDGAFFTDMQHGYVFGSGGPSTVLATDDGGATWRLVLDLAPLDQQIESIVFLDRSTFWVLDRSGRLRRTTDGGRTFTMSTPNFVDQLTGKSESLKCAGGLFFLTATQGWMTCGQNVLNTKDGGVSWTPRLVPLATGIAQGIWMFDQNEGTTLYGRLLHTKDGGATWVATPSSPEFGQVNCSASGACAGWVPPHGPLMISSDRANTWQDTHIPLQLGGQDELSSFQMLGPNSLFAFGSDVDTTDSEVERYIGTGVAVPVSPQRGLFLRWNGSAWSRTTVDDPHEFAGGFFVDANSGWLVANEFGVYTTTDGAQTVHLVPDYFRQIAALTPTEPPLPPDPTPTP